MIKNYLIVVAFIFFSLYVIFIINYDNNKYMYIINNNMKNDISQILKSCKIKNNYYYKIKNKEEYVKYMNNISCKCKGIGYWGGFCLNKQLIDFGYKYSYDKSFANMLATMFYNKTVVDLGCGIGYYCKFLSNKIKKCDGFDGAVNIEEVTDGRVKYLNLAEPIKFECKYDIVMSLEVAEHIPKKYEDVFVNNLINCSREGVLITWSKIGQSGLFHVNNKNKKDVISIFERKGLKYIDYLTNKIKKEAKISWLKNNLLYFRYKS